MAEQEDSLTPGEVELSRLSRRLTQYRAGEQQACFIRAYVEREGVTGLDYRIAVRDFRRFLVITGTAADGRNVTINVDAQEVLFLRNGVEHNGGREYSTIIRADRASGEADVFALTQTYYPDSMGRMPRQSSRFWQGVHTPLDESRIIDLGYSSFRHHSQQVDSYHPQRWDDWAYSDEGAREHRRLLGFAGCLMSLSPDQGDRRRLAGLTLPLNM